MTRREAIMAAGAGIICVAFVSYLAINRVFLLPAEERVNQARDIQAKIDRAVAERKKEDAHKAHLKSLIERTFGNDELKVSEEVRSLITEVLSQSGVSAQNLSLKPLVGSRVPGVYKEIGWTVRVRGKLAQIINFLYLTAREPHLHRLDNLVLNPVPGGTDVELQVKYGTLVLEPPKGEKMPPIALAEGMDLPPLDAPERTQYNLIATRDLFRPYIPGQKRPQQEERPPRDEPRSPREAAPPRVPEGRYRVVGLPFWGGTPDIIVRDTSGNKVAKYKPGEELAGGKIVTVDYRPMPLPNKPEILSQSRVVLLIGGEYYAVELGSSLAEKHLLKPNELPPGLVRPRPAPAAPVVPGTVGVGPPAGQP